MNEPDIEREEWLSPAEAELLGALRAMAGRLDPVPVEVVEAAKASLTWRSIDAELAELAYDSFADAAENDRAALVRGGGRLLAFDSGTLGIEVEVVEHAGARRVQGQVVPPQPALVEVLHRAGVVEAEADAVGRFVADGVAAGPLSIRVRAGAEGRGALVETEWIVV